MYHQATWDEPLIIEKSQAGKRGHIPTGPSDIERKIAGDLGGAVPRALRRNGLPPLPEVSEPEVIRHFVRLSQENYSPDLGIYPLGSCTMKYNPKSAELAVSTHKLEKLHPEQDESTVQGMLALLYRLDRILAEITGMSRMSLQPAAGAHGEYLGCLIIRSHHRSRGELEKRTEMIVPDSSHGTNPASAAMAGFKVMVVPSNSEGMVDLEELRKLAGPNTVGKIRAVHCNSGILVRAYAYIMSLGAEGLKTVAETAVLNTNYILSRILASGTYELPFARARKHEFVLSAKKLYDSTGVRAMDLAKRMLDKGVHAPTTYFPQIVDEALMVEVPETESLADLDQLVEALLGVYREAQTNPELVKDAPHYASVRRIDDVKASHPKTLTLHWNNPTLLENRKVSNEEISPQESKSGLTSPPSR